LFYKTVKLDNNVDRQRKEENNEDM
jgi:hypothetical protein